MNRFLAPGAFFLFFLPSMASAQFYTGGLGGLAILSADGRSVVTPQSASFSLYKPENGGSFSIFFGWHVHDYLSVQADYNWSSNDLTLSATTTSAQGNTLYQEARNSSEQSVFGHVLVYFRDRRSWVRPYLSAGTGVARFHCRQVSINALTGTPALPPKEFVSLAAGLPVAVGIDVTIGHKWALRYSFRETMRSNPVSSVLSPPGQRNLKTYENLLGFVRSF
jgi:hypothetical protein